MDLQLVCLECLSNELHYSHSKDPKRLSAGSILPLKGVLIELWSLQLCNGEFLYDLPDERV